jgi:biotin carboxylase
VYKYAHASTNFGSIEIAFSVIVRGASREQAIERLVHALRAFDIQGVKHNIPAVVAILESDAFGHGNVHTGIVDEVLGRAQPKGRR